MQSTQQGGYRQPLGGTASQSLDVVAQEIREVELIAATQPWTVLHSGTIRRCPRTRFLNGASISNGPSFSYRCNSNRCSTCAALNARMQEIRIRAFLLDRLRAGACGQFITFTSRDVLRAPDWSERFKGMRTALLGVGAKRALSVRVVELGKRNHPHLHVIRVGKHMLSGRDIRAIAERASLGFSWTRSIGSRAQDIRRISGYMTKELPSIGLRGRWLFDSNVAPLHVSRGWMKGGLDRVREIVWRLFGLRPGFGPFLRVAR
jgi:hypothetical protein